ncbi:MAG: hypothetical protein NTU97_01695 [Candidatus Magasanikbacteria bacterium]|nr:hypothetical protein [Candidatus Magasanikbacteria bacterium]
MLGDLQGLIFSLALVLLAGYFCFSLLGQNKLAKAAGKAVGKPLAKGGKKVLGRFLRWFFRLLGRGIVALWRWAFPPRLPTPPNRTNPPRPNNRRPLGRRYPF